MKKPRMLVIGLALTMLLPLGAGAPAFAQPDETAELPNNGPSAGTLNPEDGELSTQDLEIAEEASAAHADETGSAEPIPKATPSARTARANGALVCAPPGEKPARTSVLELAEDNGAPQPLEYKDGSETKIAKAYARLFVQPAVVTFEKVNFTDKGIPTDIKSGEYITYVAFYDAERKLTLASRTVTGNPDPKVKDIVGEWKFTSLMDTDGKDFLLFQNSPERNISMTVDRTGVVHLVAGHFVSRMAYWKSSSRDNPMDLVPFNFLVNEPTTDKNGNLTGNEMTVTNPQIFTDRAGVVRLMFRGGWSYLGQVYLYHIDRSTGKWTNTIGEGSAPLLQGWSKTLHAPSADRIHYNTVDGYYYLAYTWRIGGGGGDATTINLIRTKDFTTWSTATNHPLSVPLVFGDDKALVEDVPLNSGIQISNVKVGEDNVGWPTVSYTRTTESGTAISVARLNNAAVIWRVSTLTPWQGQHNLADSTALVLTSGTTASNSNQNNLTISYDCMGESRELTIGRALLSGTSTLVSNTPKTENVLPDSVTKREYSAEKYSMNIFTSMVDSVDLSKGQTILKWETGKPAIPGVLPANGTFPGDGSTLYISLAARPVLALDCSAPDDSKAPLPTEIAVKKSPEPLLDKNGVAAKTYTGLYAQPAVVSTDRIPTDKNISGTNRPKIPITYVAFYDVQKVLTVGMRTGDSGPWTFVTPLGKDGNQVVLSGDTHNGISMDLDKTGQLHMIANVHSAPMTYWRSKSPSTPLEFDFYENLAVNVSYIDSNGMKVDHRTDAEAAVTYPRFIMDKAGVLRLTMRYGWSNGGVTTFYHFNTDNGKWMRMTQSWGVLEGFAGDKHSPYPTQLQYNEENGYYYMAYTWQDAFTVESTSTISVIRTNDFENWSTATGKPLTLPIRYGNPDTMVQDVPTNSGLINTNLKLSFDSRGLPAVTYVREVDSGTVLSIARLSANRDQWRVSTLRPWTGSNDLRDLSKLTTLLLNSGAETRKDSPYLYVNYLCNGKVRELTLRNDTIGGQTALVSNKPIATGVYPKELTASEFTTENTSVEALKNYEIASRTVTTGSDEGTLVLRWESGAMVSNGLPPKPGSFPAEGSTLLIAVAEK